MLSAGHRKQRTVELKLNIVVKSANNVGIYSDGNGLEIYLCCGHTGGKELPYPHAGWLINLHNFDK